MATKDLKSDVPDPKSEPEVYAVSMVGGHPKFSRRRFVELAAAGSAAIALGACGDSDDDTYVSTPPTSETPTTTSSTTSTTTSTTTTRAPTTTTTRAPTTTTQPPRPGTLPPGGNGIELDIDGESFTLPCLSPIPEGAVCTCNCVEVPSCGCVGHSTCSCVGHTACTCDSHTVTSHYWYPN